MKTNEIENLLRQMKDDPDFGALDSDSSARLKDRVFSFVDTSIAEQPMAPSGVFDFVTSLPGVFTDMVARPMALTSLMIVMVLGGWITSVNASLDTLPGDAFYGVKLVSEKAQLVLASSNTKSKLHAEFASRRLDEIVTLVQGEGDSDERQGNVQTAIDGFNKQMDGVSAHLQESTDEEMVVELARIIDQKAGELEGVLELAEDDVESHVAITEAIETAEDVQGQAVETLVEQSEDSHTSRTELSRQFANEIREVDSQTNTVTARLERLEAALESREDVEADLTDIKAMLFKQDLSDSMDSAAIGGYKNAFELTTEAKRDLREATEQIMVLEIQLTQPVVDEAEPIEDSTVESPDEPADAQSDIEVEHTE